MKINNKFFSFPPYISTQWNNVKTLHMKGSSLVVSLMDGNVVDIPGLETTTLDSIFDVHATVMEQQDPNDNHPDITQNTATPPFSQLMLTPITDTRIDIPFHLGGETFEELGSVLQHNAAHSNTPDLPQEILHKIVAITKIVAPEDTITLPQPQEHCNCIHCQIAKAMQDAVPHKTIQATPSSSEEEKVSDQELQFQQWDITQSGNQMFTVVNRLDTKEQYSVYLGHPVGCTCGKQGCEHIVAVLKS
jgi:hypothetical protein